MGVSLSTLGGWLIIVSIGGYYAFRYLDDGKRRDITRAAQRQRLEDRQTPQLRKENRAKKQRGDAYSKDVEDADKGSARVKPRAELSLAQQQQTGTTRQAVDLSTDDDGVDNREFARQLASVKQGTTFTASNKADEKRQKSVKQSRAREIDSHSSNNNNNNNNYGKVSATSSTAGADADDDQSSGASPEFTAADARDPTDMLERPAPGPSVLRLTDTDKVTTKDKKPAQTPEPVESKKQRQNRKKAEAAKAARDEAEEERKVKMEAQRRTARIAEGRAAKDGSTFMAAQTSRASAWAGNGNSTGTNSTGNNNGANHTSHNTGGFIPVQPLDTYEPSAQEDAGKSVSSGKAGSWMTSLPSEEEQLEMLRKEEESWSTVTTKKPAKKKTAQDVASDSNDEPQVPRPQPVAPVTSAPAANKAPKGGANGRPVKFSQQSSFAALSGNDDVAEEEQEWDV